VTANNTINLKKKDFFLFTFGHFNTVHNYGREIKDGWTMDSIAGAMKN